MATFLDLGILKNLEAVFIVLFVFVVIYALLTRFKLFENEGVNALIAFTLAAIVGFFEPARIIIAFASPWFVLLMLFLFFIVLFLMIFGVSAEKIQKYAEGKSGAQGITWTVVIVGLFIIAFAFAQVNDFSLDVDQRPEPEESDEVGVKDILFHPAVLGVITLLLIAAFAILFLGDED